jgi:hypothetical protein
MPPNSAPAGSYVLLFPIPQDRLGPMIASLSDYESASSIINAIDRSSAAWSADDGRHPVPQSPKLPNGAEGCRIAGETHRRPGWTSV